MQLFERTEKPKISSKASEELPIESIDEEKFFFFFFFLK